MAKKFPKTLLALKLDDGTIVVVEHVDEISEDFDGDVIGVYELRAAGKFEVEKTINGDALRVDAKKLKVNKRG